MLTTISMILPPLELLIGVDKTHSTLFSIHMLFYELYDIGMFGCKNSYLKSCYFSNV